MAYVTGTANSLTDLLTALQAACTGNGWTLSGNVLHKGTCYAEVKLGSTATKPTHADGALIVRGGNGIDGANALTDPSPGAPRLGPVNMDLFVDWSWPVTYHVHVLTEPDEVYLLVNYELEYWQNLCFGQSPAPGNVGSGNWCSATQGTDYFQGTVVPPVRITPDGGTAVYLSLACLPFFWGHNDHTIYGSGLNSQIHGCISATGTTIWTSATYYLDLPSTRADGEVSAAAACRPLLAYTPNAWNLETDLLPVQILQARPSAKVSLIGELQHSRFCRNDYLDDGAVQTLGGDRWKVYPAYRKDAANRNGGDGVTHSGTMAIAVRYDGP